MTPDIDLSGPVHWRNNSTGETSRDAAMAVAKSAPKQRARVYLTIASSPVPMTPEQITDALHEAGGHDMLQSVRPRCSELMRLGLIEDSGLRGIGAGGKRAIKWKLAANSAGGQGPCEDSPLPSDCEVKA